MTRLDETMAASIALAQASYLQALRLAVVKGMDPKLLQGGVQAVTAEARKIVAAS